MFLFPIDKAIIYYDIGLIIRRIGDLFSIEHSKVKSPDQIDEYHRLTAEQAVSTIKSLLQEEIDEFSIAAGDSDEAKEWLKLHPALCQSYIDSFEHPFEHLPCVSLTYEGNKIFLHYHRPEDEDRVTTEEHDATTIASALLEKLMLLEDYYTAKTMSKDMNEAAEAQDQLDRIGSLRLKIHQRLGY